MVVVDEVSSVCAYVLFYVYLKAQRKISILKCAAFFFPILIFVESGLFQQKSKSMGSWVRSWGCVNVG